VAADSVAKRNHNRASESTIDRDRALVDEILSGSVTAWHEFVHRYSRLIYSVLRQHLFDNDDDRVQTIFVDVLHVLYKRKLTDYTGRAALSTWLVVVTRGHLLDEVRHRRGRRRVPKGFDHLTDFEKKVFRFYYMELLPYEALLPTLNWRCDVCTAADVVAAVQRIEDVVDRRFLDRTGVERTARDTGVGSGRDLACLLSIRDSYRREADAAAPDEILDEREEQNLLERLRHLLGGLSERDRRVVDLKFDEGWSAARIDREMDLGGQRRVYAILERVIRQLRRGLTSGAVGSKFEPKDVIR